jgi:hypothetical protein
MIRPNYQIIICAFALFLSFKTNAQVFTQTIRGSVTDAATGEPLIGATIQVLDLSGSVGDVTDVDGNYSLEKIPVGRHSIQCSYIGYETKVAMLLLNSAKEGNLNFTLSVQSQGLQVIEVKNPVNALNPLALVSVRSVTPEETQYYPTSANDFGRCMVSLPGIQPSKDNENDIIIRGNSFVGLLWRLEGIDILNPNHFARTGSSAGGITIFSISVLA